MYAITEEEGYYIVQVNPEINRFSRLVMKDVILELGFDPISKTLKTRLIAYPAAQYTLKKVQAIEKTVLRTCTYCRNGVKVIDEQALKVKYEAQDNSTMLPLLAGPGMEAVKRILQWNEYFVSDTIGLGIAMAVNAIIDNTTTMLLGGKIIQVILGLGSLAAGELLYKKNIEVKKSFRQFAMINLAVAADPRPEEVARMKREVTQMMSLLNLGVGDFLKASFKKPSLNLGLGDIEIKRNLYSQTEKISQSTPGGKKTALVNITERTGM